MIDIKYAYISGKSGSHDEIKQKLTDAGFFVFDPINTDKLSFYDDVCIRLAALTRCNYIYQPDNWENDDIAVVEWYVAKLLDIKVINHDWLGWYTEVANENKNRRKDHNTKSN